MENERDNLKTFFENEKKREYSNKEDFALLLSKLEDKVVESKKPVLANSSKIWTSHLNYFVAFATCYVFIFWFVNVGDKNNNLSQNNLENNNNNATGTILVNSNQNANNSRIANNTNNNVNNNSNNYDKQQLKNETIAVLDEVDSFNNQETYEEI